MAIFRRIISLDFSSFGSTFHLSLTLGSATLTFYPMKDASYFILSVHYILIMISILVTKF